MSTFLWILLAALYLVVLISFGMITLRKGHWFMFLLGIPFPIMWFIGAAIAPVPRVTTAP